MKEYCSIPGWKDATQELPCIAFAKYDGSNIRFEYNRKSGWNKFGTRHCLLDRNNPDFGPAIPLFEKTMAESLAKILRDNTIFKGLESAVVFCEYFGKNSFAGLHDPNDEKKLVIIDVNVHKKGIILPKDFIRIFAGLPIAEVVYEGLFTPEFISDVINGVYPVDEGVVVKGVDPSGKKEQHSLWMAKVKTKKWMDRLRALASERPELKQTLIENNQEQV